MRSFLNAATKVVVLQWPLGVVLSMRRFPRFAQPGFGPGLVDEYEPARIDQPLIFALSLAMARDIRAGLFARDQRLF
jgi:hypothetical protein